MKKMLFVILMLGIAVGIHAQKNDPCTVNIDKNSKLPVGWNVQAVSEEKKNVILEEIPDSKSRFITIVPQKHQIIFFGPSLEAIKGDTFKVMVTAKGKGKFIVGYFAYGENNKYLFGKSANEVLLADNNETSESIVKIEDGNDFATRTVKLYIAVRPDNKLCLSGMKADFTE